MEKKRNFTPRYTLYGILLGLAFALAATVTDLLLQKLPLTLQNAWQVQTTTPLHWMIDSLPLFLGLFAGLVGRREDRLNQLNDKLAREVQERTAAIRDLGALRSELEKQVEAQTLDLARRSKFLEATAEVGRAVTSILDPERLMQTVADVIQGHFALHFVGLYLVDDAFEWAVLHAGSGDAGPEMLAQMHQVRIGEGMVGSSIANGQPSSASWSETDDARIGAEELPSARCKAALPLRSRGAILGALTVHATQSDAFDPVFIALLQSMGDHVAVALDNARLSAQSREVTQAAQRVQADLSSRSWSRYLQTQPELAFRSDANGVRRLSGRETLQHDAHDERGSQDGDLLAIPITIRGHTIGRLETYKPAADGTWTQDELQLVQQVVEQLGLALEDARLYESAQRRAQREQLIASISDKIRTAPDIDSILRVTVQQIRRALGVSYGAIRLGTETHLRPPQPVRATPAPLLDDDGPGDTELDRDHHE